MEAEMAFIYFLWLVSVVMSGYVGYCTALKQTQTPVQSSEQQKPRQEESEENYAQYNPKNLHDPISYSEQLANLQRMQEEFERSRRVTDE